MCEEDKKELKQITDGVCELRSAWPSKPNDMS